MDEKNNLFIRRFFNDRYSRNDYLNFRDQVQDHPNDFEKNVNEHWDEFLVSELTNQKDLSPVKSFINDQINKDWKLSLVKSLYINYSKVAAILLIPILVAVGVLYFKLNDFVSQQDTLVELHSPNGAQTQLNLPDGSQVWLNGNSSIKYPAVFKGNRIVELDGEAFFKVKSDKKNPFLVSAKNLYVKATGTQFNVKAYSEEDNFDVILKEGKVSVLDSRKKDIQSMESGYLFQLRNDNQYEYKTIDAQSYSNWINGKLIFKNAGFEEVIERLEHRYGVEIELHDEELYNLHFKATFTNESIEDALRLLQSTATFKYRFERNNSSGQSKIIITKI